MHKNGPILVVAGAGTGKTTVITRRIAWLIEQGLAQPEEILALTFTDKAAREMEERVDLLVPYGVVNTNIMTFHSFGDRILREFGLEIGLRLDYVVMPGFAQLVFLQNLMKDLPPHQLKYYKPMHDPMSLTNALLRHFSRLKDEDITPSQYTKVAKLMTRTATSAATKLEAAKYTELSWLYQRYVTAGRDAGRIDFGDQIQLALEVLKRPNLAATIQKRYKFIMVDEYQDTNVAQNKLLMLLHDQTRRNFMVVGDDDQSIYQFRGAAIANILAFKAQFPRARQIVLRHNYRSSQTLLNLSYRLIQFNNPDRLEVRNKIDKRLIGRKGGSLPHLQQFSSLPDELEFVADRIAELIKLGTPPPQIAVLLRKNNQADLITPYLKRRGITYNLTQATSLVEQPSVRMLLNLIRFLHDQTDSTALYSLLQSEVYQIDLQNLSLIAARARRSHRPLAEFILETLESDDVISTAVGQLQEFRSQIRELSAGELLYNYLVHTKYLSQLVDAAQTDDSAAHKIQHISEFFNFIKQFELASRDVDLVAFATYAGEINASGNELSTDSPLDNNAVNITTIHKAKGLEFEAVFLIDVVQNTFPSPNRAETITLPAALIKEKDTPGWHIKEERRLFYVGLTRAKSELYVTASLDHGGVRAKKISQFSIEAFGQAPAFQPTVGLANINKITQFDRQPSLPFDPLAVLINDGWLHLSVNQVADYLRSPREFWYWHVLNLPKGPFHSLIYGSAVHAAMAAYYTARNSDGGQPVALKDLYAVFDSQWRSEGFVSLSHEQERRRQGRQVLRHFYTREQKQERYPIHLEEPFLLSLPDLKMRLSGRYDAVYDDNSEKGVEIRDFKTGNVDTEAKARKRLRDSIQLGIYAYAWDKSHDKAVQKTSLWFVEHDIVVVNDKIDNERTLEILRDVNTKIRERKFDDPGQSRLNFETFL